MKKRKKKKYNPQKLSEAARREQEIKDCGRILSLRPSVVHTSKKTYKRDKKAGLRDED